MYNKVLALLQEEYPEVDFTSSDELVDEGILDSLTLTGIIAALSIEFDIEIPYDEIIEENYYDIYYRAFCSKRTSTTCKNVIVI